MRIKIRRGFLAREISQYLGLTITEGDTLFYQSLTQLSFIHSNDENQIEFVLHLSELMLKWNEQQLDIVNQINSLNIKNNLQNSMLKAYHTYEKELFLRQPQSLKKDNQDPFQQEQSKWEVYRDVMFAATQGRFLLISEIEASKYKVGNVFCEGIIKERSDIPACRNLARECLELKGFNKTKVMSWLLVLSEAITNTIKHAEEGKMTLVESEQNSEIRFVIEDRGRDFACRNCLRPLYWKGIPPKNQWARALL
ncbi:ATP-binding protein [Neobacillus sp. PS3-34]|uniref:ATP-binding protein n=1 Tax=Neobacillus sp. PS3-34 TaxID=3070678 RepID=UPI0027DFC09B|nr:ATP-binding protein [Neobacillus sp. PS3-34]WML49529.1 ATP-binding protein [Neobacillus sp. PS3-34]